MSNTVNQSTIQTFDLCATERCYAYALNQIGSFANVRSVFMDRVKKTVILNYVDEIPEDEALYYSAFIIGFRDGIRFTEGGDNL